MGVVSDFFLELRCEEIPARMQAGARAELERLFRREMDAAGIVPADVTTYSTPRRLALIARDLPEATQAVSEEAKGPPEGAPDSAINGFCRKNGVTREQLELRDVKGRATWFAVIKKPGRATRDLLAESIPVIVRDFSWPKSMRWGAASISTESQRWVRPLSGIVAILGEDLVPCEISGLRSGYATLGHRFHHPGPITIGGAHDYVEKLRACQVIVDHEERALLIRQGARGVAAKAGLSLVEDEGLVVENAGLTEWPMPLLGHFDEAFLDVPPEVIQLTARVNQKYFVCNYGAGRLANAFICTANIEAADGGAAIVDGNRKVLAARLADARFFWEQDRKKTLAQHAEGLARITFHEKLGTVADKVERVAKLARWLVEEGIVGSAPVVTPAKAGVSIDQAFNPTEIPASAGMTRQELANLAEQAARLCKADLVTEMVGEFPELQGIMGGYYARAEGLPAAVADAIRNHYKPAGQGDEVPTAPVTVAVSLADKLDTLIGFFRAGEVPTGSKDPFALRRAALGVLALLASSQFSMRLREVINQWRMIRRTQQFAALARRHPILRTIELPERITSFGTSTVFDDQGSTRGEMLNINGSSYGPFKHGQFSEALDIFAASKRVQRTDADLLNFLADRLKVQQREAGVRHDLIDAVFALGNEDDLVRLLARVNALQSFIETPDGQNLLAAYKRAANILKKEDWTGRAKTEQGALNTQGVARTGEEDPLAIVDDPELRVVVEAQMRQKRENALSYTPAPAEKALIDALDTAEPQARAAVAAEDFTAAMQALASLRQPIDAFFDTVTVNDPDGDKRAARLDLLARFREAVGQVADFGRIEG